MERCHFAILGPGRIAEKFADTFRRGLVHNASLVAVASHSADRAAAFAGKYGISKSYGDYDSLFQDPGVDIVYIATTNNAHYACCMQAIEAGKHVLCEKPMTMTKNEGVALAQAAKKKNVFLMEAMWTRFLPAVRKVAEWAVEGRIGTPKAASASLCAARDPKEFRRLYDPVLGGGAAYDLGIYAIQLVQYLARGKKLRTVLSTLIPAETGVDLSTFLHMVYDDGFVGEIKCSIGLWARNEAYLYGDRGYIRIAPFFNYAQRVELFTEPMPKSGDYNIPEPNNVFLAPTPSGFEFEIEHAAQCILEGQTESDRMPMADTIECAGIFDQLLAQRKEIII